MGKSKLPKSWTTVTPFSKTLALILYIVLPFIGFYFGTKYATPLPTAKLAKSEINISSKKEISNDLFSARLPISWTVVDETNESNQRRIYLRNEGGKNYIGVSVISANEVKNQISYITSYAQRDFEKKQIFIGGEKATQYYGCVGVEGCGDIYNIFVVHNGINYQITFGANLDVPTLVFEDFISSFKFTN